MEAGAPIYEGDVVETKENAAVGIEFEDKTTLSLGADARMVLDEFVYNPAEKAGNLGVSVLQGAFSFVSGEVAKLSPDSMIVTTPTATIGIRGTKVAGIAAAEGELSTISLLPEGDGTVGAISIANEGGSVVLTQAGATIQITSFNQAPPAPIILSQAEISSKFGGALNALPAPSPSPSGDNQNSDQGGEEDQSDSSGESEGVEEAIKAANEATEELKAQTQKAHLEGRLAAQRLGKQVAEARAEIERFSEKLERDIRRFEERAKEDVLKGEEVRFLSRDFGGEVGKFAGAIQAASNASSLSSSAEVLAAQALTIAQLNGSPDEQISRLEALGAASAVSSAATAQIQFSLALSTTAARGESIDQQLIDALNLSTAKTLNAASSSANAIIKSIGAIAAEAYSSSWKYAKHIRGLNDSQADLKANLSLNPFKGLVDSLTKKALDAGNKAAKAAETAAEENNATPSEKLRLKDAAFKKASEPYEALKAELNIILQRAVTERDAIEQEASNSASNFASKAADITAEINKIAEQTNTADATILQSAKMAAEAVKAAVSSASSASETVRLGVIAGKARDQAFKDAVDSGKSGADALGIANAVAKGYADACKASASAAKKAQETAQNATKLASLARNGQIAKAEFDEFTVEVSKALSVADEFINAAKDYSLEGLTDHISTVTAIIDAGGSVADAEAKSLERLSGLKTKIDSGLSSFTSLSNYADKAETAGGALEKIEFSIDATASDEILELLSEGALADTASSLSDAAITASVDAAAAADAFIDGSAEKSVSDKKVIVSEKEKIKSDAESKLEVANSNVTDARSDLVELLVVEAQKKALVNALDKAKSEAETALVNPSNNLISAQGKLAQATLNLSEKELELASAKKVLSENPLSAEASANTDLAQAAVDLASQLTDNAKSELSFVEQIHNLFKGNLEKITTDLGAAKSEATTAESAVADQQALLLTLEAKAADSLSDALTASDDYTSALTELAQAEGFLSIAQAAAVTQAEVQVNSLIGEAFAAANLAEEAAAEAKLFADAAKFDATEGSHPDKPGTVDKPGAAENAQLASDAALRATAARELAESAVEEAKFILNEASSYSSQDITAIASRNAAISSAESALNSAEAAEKFAVSSKKLAQTAADLAAILNPEPVSPDELKQQLLADQAQLNFARAEKDAELTKQLASEAAANQAEKDKQNADINAEVSVAKILSSVEIVSEEIFVLKSDADSASKTLTSLVQLAKDIENFEDKIAEEIGDRLGIFAIEGTNQIAENFSISVTDKSGSIVSDSISLPVNDQIDNVAFGAFKGDILEGHNYSITVYGKSAVYTADGNEVSLGDVIEGLIEVVGKSEEFSFSTISDLVLEKANAASSELQKISNIADQVTILANSVELANQSAIKTASGAGSVDGLLILRSKGETDKHNLSVSLGNTGVEKDNSVEIIVGGDNNTFSAFRINGTVEAGDEFTVTINNQAVTYVVTGLEGSLNEVRDGLTAPSIQI